MLLESFIGGAAKARSQARGVEACVNLYLESARSKGASPSLIGVPGLSLLATAAVTGWRGFFAEDGRTFGVCGSVLYEIDLSATTLTSRGTVLNGGPVTFASNGRAGEQLAVCAGGSLYIYDLALDTLSSAISLPLTNAAAMVTFMDGYFLLLEQDSPTMWFSALEDGTTWDPLDFFIRSHVSDNLIAFAVVGDRLWTFGSKTAEVFYDSGDADTPFVPYPGSLLPFGIVAPFALAVQGQTLVWLSRNAAMLPTVMAVSFGEAPKPVSSAAIEQVFTDAPTVTDAEACAYAQEGHAFVAFTLPSAGTEGETWVVDLIEGAWHQRAAWDGSTGRFARWPVRALCATGSQVLAGDYLTGALYALDLDTYTNNGDVLRRLRRCPVPADDNQWLFVSAIELGMDPGVGLSSGQGSDPEVMLRVSKDSGMTWGALVTASLGRLGHYTARAIWNRIGRVRADRLVIEVSQSDPVRTVWTPGLWIRATQGTGQL